MHGKQDLYGGEGRVPATAIIYKTLIKSGCKVLFATPLSYFTQEIEILTPIDCLIAFPSNNIIYEDFNNINKTYGICYKNDKNRIHTINVAIYETPPSQYS